MNGEERGKMSEIVKEGKAKNELRTEAEKGRFCLRVRDQKLNNGT